MLTRCRAWLAIIVMARAYAKDSADEAVDKLVDNLVDRAHLAWHPYRAELENTTLKKTQGLSTVPQARRQLSLPIVRSSIVSKSARWMPMTASMLPALATTSASYGIGMRQRWRSQLQVCQAYEAPTRETQGQIDRQRAEELIQLGQELAATALKSGPGAAYRTVQALEAAVAIGTDVAAEVGNRPAGAPLPTVPNVLRRFCEKLGATYIKLGQFVASAPTIFPKDFVEEFQKCLDQAPPVPFPEVRQTVEAGTGEPLFTTFSEFDETPVASASVAVVHRAVLRNGGQEVAVKVLRPGIGSKLSVDLDFIKSAAKILQFLQPELKRLSLADIASDIQTSMLEEVDLRKELNNLKAFRAYLEVSGAEGVTAPRPFDQFCSERVLVSEFLRGVPLTDLEAIRGITKIVRETSGKARDPEEVLINALNAWVGSVFLAESFHADVHAGNLLALPNGDVAFIDFGIVGRIKQSTWGAIRELFKSFSTRAPSDPTQPSTAFDYETMAKALVTIGATEDSVKARVDIPAFAEDLKKLFSSIDDLEGSMTVTETVSRTTGGTAGVQTAATANLNVDEAALNRAVGNLAAVGERYGLKFPREFGLLVKQALYFDRYTKILAPTLQVGADPRIRDVPDSQPDYIDVQPAL